jgi:TolB-like protein/DNA-binding SARP family transcriptional activator/Tfp pilus assembly protein PilF
MSFLPPICHEPILGGRAITFLPEPFRFETSARRAAVTFTLQLFGGASLQAAGQPLQGPVAQRRRLALLALIAVPEHRPVARDKLIAFLWPESSTERARHLLSESVYVIRKALGERAITAVGDELHLQPEVVTTDVREFQDALAENDLERALMIYRGPFLDGFFVDGAPEFERWVEQERTSLTVHHRRTLEEVAQQRQASGDLVGAVEALRRLTHCDPYNSRFALRLMQALAAAGDRAAALQHARVHATLLRDEFQAEPEPEIEAYAELLRVEPETALPSAPAEHPSDREVRTHPFASSVGREAHAPDSASALMVAPATAGSATRDPLAAPQPGAGSRRRRAGPPRRAWIAAGIGTLLLVATIAGLTAERSRRAAPNASLAGAAAGTESATAIAVLPFADLSPNRDHEWFSDGIAEELIHSLSRLEEVRVPARTSTFAFKGKDMDVREIGRRLGVTHVLEGSVRRAGNEVRVAAQLISVSDGYPLWSETYSVPIAEIQDLFAVQDDIARSIVTTLRVRLAARDALPRSQPPTTDAEAYHLFQHGQYFWNQRSPDGLQRGMQLFQQAIERDASFSLAHGALAESYALLVTYGALSPAEGYTRTREAAERALVLDPSLPQAHASLALVRLYLDHDWAGAEEQFLRALQHSPSYATGRQWYAQFLAYRSETDRALEEIHRAQELDPLSPAIQTAMGTVFYYARRYDLAAEQFRRALALEQNNYLARLQLGAVYLQQQRHAEALTEVREAVRISDRHPLPLALLGYLHAVTGRPGEARELLAELDEQARHRHVSPAYLAAIHMGLQEHDTAFRWLERTYEARDDWAIFLRVEPTFDPLRPDPRYSALLARIGP